MFSMLVGGRELSSDLILDLLAHLLSSNVTNSEQNTLKASLSHHQEPEAVIALAAEMDENWLMTAASNFLTGLAMLVLLILLLIPILHIPLTPGICDWWKIHAFELLMRVSNEYFADLVEFCFGVRIRNKLSRFLGALPFWLMQRRPPKWCIIRDEMIAGVRCRVYLPQGKMRKSDAAIINIHGGGWCIMRPHHYDGPIKALIVRTGMTVISIDYDLSPEVQFPVALLQCERVIKELHERKYADYGIDPSKLALMGDSAGGNMCAVLCQRALRAGNPSIIKCQILLYPVIHFLDFQSPSYQLYYRAYKNTALLNPKLLIRWSLFYMGIEPTEKNIKIVTRNRHLSRDILENKELMTIIHQSRLPLALLTKDEELHCSKISEEKISNEKASYKSYTKLFASGENSVTDGNFEGADQKLLEKMGKLLLNPDLCPILGKDLQGLAPALICTAGVDILRDEGILYAERLKEFDVPVQLNHYETAYHGILCMPFSKQRKQMLNDISAFLQAKL